MDPVHIFYNELEMDEDNIFTTNIAKENEIEKVLFDKNKEYAVSGLKIKPEISDSDLVKIKNTGELNKISKEIQVIIKNCEEPDLTFSISNPETKTMLIPFEKTLNLIYQEQI